MTANRDDFPKRFPGPQTPLVRVRHTQRKKAFLVPLLGSLGCFLVVLFLLPLKLQAATVPFFLPGGGMFTKKVKSYKEQRMTKVIPQSVDYSCGAAALATLMHYYFGRQITEKEATLGMFKHGNKDEIRKRGFSMLDMKRFAINCGMKVDGYKIKDPQTLKQLKIPVIVIISTARYKHFVVLKKVDDRFVYLADPSWGNRKIPFDDFLANWNNVILVVTGPINGAPEGLYCKADDCTLPKDRAVHNCDVLGHRFSMDPTNAIYRVTPTISGGIPGVTQ